MEKYKPPYKCNKCPEESFTRKYSTKRHVDRKHSGDCHILDSNGKLVTFDNRSLVGKSSTTNEGRSLEVYLEERVRERARLDEQAFHNEFEGSEGYLRHIFRLYDNMSQISPELREILYRDLGTGKLNWALGFHAMVDSLTRDARSTAAKIEELRKLGGKQNEIANLMEELAGYRTHLPGIVNQLQQLLNEDYKIGKKSKQVRES